MNHSRVSRKLLQKLLEPSSKAKMRCPDVRWKVKPWSKGWKLGEQAQFQTDEEVDGQAVK